MEWFDVDLFEDGDEDEYDFDCEEVHIEPVHDGCEQVIVVARGRFLVELVPHLHLARSTQSFEAPAEAGELCYM